MTRPPYCSSCALHASSTGFLPDLVPLSPRAAFVLRYPYKDDLLYGEPLTSPGGRMWEREFLRPTGLRRDQVILSNVLRCYPKAGEMPTGKDRPNAVRHCAHWDTALLAWKPNVWIVTIAPSMLLKSPNQAVFLHRAMAKAADFSQRGYRPCVLMGEEAKEKYAPWLNGGLKKWQGHTWYSEALVA